MDSENYDNSDINRVEFTDDNFTPQQQVSDDIIDNLPNQDYQKEDQSVYNSYDNQNEVNLEFYSAPESEIEAQNENEIVAQNENEIVVQNENGVVIEYTEEKNDNFNQLEIENKQIETVIDVESANDNVNEDFTELQSFTEDQQIQEDQLNSSNSSEEGVEEIITITRVEEEGDEEQEDEEGLEKVEESVEKDVEKVEKEVEKVKKRRTRKPVYDYPMHLLGHNVDKPIDPVPNGKAIPKPRIGVKVPYRNLTSQIVSKAELEAEIFERSRQKEIATKKIDKKFARGLTQRLANKIFAKKEEESQQQQQKEEESSKSTTTTTSTSKIRNDDDLLAILEGDGEEEEEVVEESININNKKKEEDIEIDDSNLKLLEREIALQQLQELPNQTAKERIIKPKQQQHKLSKIIDKKIDTKSKLIEPEPQIIKVLKTYSRKRKIDTLIVNKNDENIDNSDDENDNKNDEKDPLAIPNDVYVTKSSRIIKKKVIWDPDDEKSGGKFFSSGKSSSAAAGEIIGGKNERKSVGGKIGEKIGKIGATPAAKKVLTKKINVVNKPKRGLSEVDRLLMDEGAVKMLFELKNEDSTQKKKKTTIYSVEKAEKEIQKKANALKTHLVQQTNNESPKSLRKKEEKNKKELPPPILERKMSENSTRSSVQTPPRSPIFQFSQQKSMLIRRRSSSSISSNDDIDFSKKKKKDDESIDIKKKKKQRLGGEDESIDVKKKKENELIDGKKKKKRRGSELSVGGEEEKEEESISEKSIIKKTKKKMEIGKLLMVVKNGKHVSIDLCYPEGNCYFTISVLEELTLLLKKLEKDKDCSVVSLTSSNDVFCLGLDYSLLVSSDFEKQTENATKLADVVRKFLLCLLSFPKIIVAGIQGECVGLGVTMLSLFDVVLASDKATFRTPYAQLGCLGEGTCILTYPNFGNKSLAAELIYINQTLKADEAFRRGLISKLCWPEKYKETLKNTLFSISNGSQQCLQATKRQIRADIQEGLAVAIGTEMDILIEHWTSPECQKNFSKLYKDK